MIVKKQRIISAAILAVLCTAATTTISSAAPPRLQKIHYGVMPPSVRLQATPRSSPKVHRIIVKYRAGRTNARDVSQRELDLSAAAVRAGLTHSAGARNFPVTFRRQQQLATGALVFSTSTALAQTDVESLLREIRIDPAVLYAQVDFIKSRADVTPNDTYFSSLQWDFTDPVGGVSAPGAWEITRGDGIVVSVLDTGYVDHRDLTQNLVPGYDFISWHGQVDDGGTLLPDVSRDGDGRDADAHDPGDWDDDVQLCSGQTSSWHGTHVAGTIAAVTNNAFGLAGLAHGAKVQPVRVLGHCGGLTSDIADAIVWAAGGHVEGVPDNPTPAEILNLSLGGGGKCSEDPVTQEAIDFAIARGTTVVVAAGNSGSNASTFSPASCKGVITVGATGIGGTGAWYSNYGPSVGIAAPGGDATSGNTSDSAYIWSLGNSGQRQPDASPGGDALLGMIGTSMAAPHVAAVAALVQSASVAGGNGALTPAQVKSLLLATASPFSVQPPAARTLGRGIVNAEMAVVLAHRGFSEQDLAPQLISGSALQLPDLAGSDSQLLRIRVPAGKRNLNLRTYGGSGDVSLYLGRENVPDPDKHLAASVRSGTTEAIVLASPVAGDYYIQVKAETASSGVTVLATIF